MPGSMDLTTELAASNLDHWFSSDAQMHHLYPRSMQELAIRHWTPLHITKLVTQFLVPQGGVKVLDIGSGVGKFCLAGAYYKPEAAFYGVEQRQHLIYNAITARKILGLKNVHFLHQNLTHLDFTQYDHFYFYNSFYENLADTDKIDNSITCCPELFNYYNRQLYKKLDQMPAGTRLATFHSPEEEIPPSYYLLEQHKEKLLKFWIKV
jgi:SAM-dependent methyltransferase